MLAVSYAMAENTFGVTQTSPGQPPKIDVVKRRALEQELRALPIDSSNSEAVAKVSCGLPIAGTTVKVVGHDGHVLSERRVGEIAIKSKCMLSEYYKRPDLYPFEDGWYMTGDTGYVADEHLYVVGRSKDLIINAGKNIYPQDIESIVNEIHGVTPGRAVVFGVFDDREGTELIVIVAETTINDAAKQQLLSKTIRQEVSRRSMVTASYVMLVEPKWLIKTSSGKIARGANREKWLAEQRQ
jgi:acyl-CoA synthetase (AMP-forming)/AMP-acid ligase II